MLCKLYTFEFLIKEDENDIYINGQLRLKRSIYSVCLQIRNVKIIEFLKKERARYILWKKRKGMMMLKSLLGSENTLLN